jgi:hypothetical protein
MAFTRQEPSFRASDGPSSEGWNVNASSIHYSSGTCGTDTSASSLNTIRGRSPHLFSFTADFHPLCPLFTGAFMIDLFLHQKLADRARYRPFSGRAGVLLFIRRVSFGLFAAVPLPCPARLLSNVFGGAFPDLSGTTRYGCREWTFPS